jgi:hypothetical protein
MTWTYSGNPGASPKDEVRWRIGDTEITRQLVQDEEIMYELNKAQGDVLSASQNTLTSLLVKLSTLGKVQLGGPNGTWSYDATQIAAGLKDALDVIGNTILNGVFYSGGISKAEVQRVAGNGDRVQPRFRRGMMGNRGSVGGDWSGGGGGYGNG